MSRHWFVLSSLCAGMLLARVTVAEVAAPTPRPNSPPATMRPVMVVPKLVVGVAIDGRSVVVREGQPPPARDPQRRWTRYSLPSLTLTEAWREDAIDSLPWETLNDGGGVRGNHANAISAQLQTPELRQQLAHRAAIYATLRSPRDERFAVSSDGARIVFNGGDWLYVADGQGNVLARVDGRASYNPRFQPGTHRFAYAGHSGLLDRVVANYMIYLADAERNPHPQRVEGTRDAKGESVVWSNDGQHLYVQLGHEAPANGCLAHVSVRGRSVSRAQTMHCIEGGARLRQIGFSPARDIVALHVELGAQNHLLRWLRLTTPERVQVLGNYSMGYGSLGTVLENGLTLADVGAGGAVLDPLRNQVTRYTPPLRVPYAFWGAAWVTSTAYVHDVLGRLELVDLAQLRGTTSGPMLRP